MHAAAQCPYAEEYEKKSESFHLYPADIDKPLLRNIEIIADGQSEKLKMDIKESLASLSRHLQGEVDKICQKIFGKLQIQEQNQQVYVAQIKDEIKQLLIQHKQESLRALQTETNGLIRKFDEAIEKQQADNKRMLTLYKNSQLETNTYVFVIFIILIIVLLQLTYTLEKLTS